MLAIRRFSVRSIFSNGIDLYGIAIVVITLKLQSAKPCIIGQQTVA